MYRHFFKRLFDLIIAFVALAVLSPLLLVLTVVGAVAMKGNPFFVQKRPGLIDRKTGKERIISLLKFRTMSNARDSEGNLLPDSVRLNRYGRFLRSTSCDELPSLINLLIGDISLVGPRPLLVKYLDHYSDLERRRHTVRPGLTGLAQVSGRNALTWKLRFEKDIEYVENVSLLGDIKILFATVKKVFAREGIEFSSSETIMDYFASRSVDASTDGAGKKALVLCGGIPQIELLRNLRSRGITTVLADMNEKVGGRPYADKFYPVSVLDAEAVKQLAIDEKVDLVITVCADQVLQVMAQVSEELGLPCYIDPATAVNVSKKTYMKQIFESHGIPTSRYLIMDEIDDSLVATLNYPLIVKPVDSYSSRGVRRVETRAELYEAFADACRISRTGNAIVEEFVEGDELTVDVYVSGGKANVLCISSLDKVPGSDRFVICRTCCPAAISPDISAQVAQAAQGIADAFGITDAPMLIQLITDGSRISVVEFCARTGGGDKFRLIKKVSGFDVVDAVVELTLGNKPTVSDARPEQKVIINEFLYCSDGVFDRLEGFEELLRDGVITEYYQLKSSGTVMSGVRNSGDRVAYFTVEADTAEEAARKHSEAACRVRALSEDGTDLLRHDIISTYRGKIS